MSGRPADAPAVPPSTRAGVAGHIVRTAIIMGLPFSIHLRPADGRQDGPADDVMDEAVEQVWRSLHRFDAVFSTYRPDSDISRINRGELTVDAADPAVAEVLELAALATRITDGAFDVRATGTLDPSGIVKAWAASRAEQPLVDLGIDYYLNAGGDVVLRSRSPRRPWRIGIEHPHHPGGLLAVVQAPTGAVATSGRAHRGGHIHDPRTGRPATGIIQATVVGPSLLWSDILATAVVAQGMTDAGIPGPNRHQWPPGHEVLLVTDRGELFGTPGLPGHLSPDVQQPTFAPLQ